MLTDLVIEDFQSIRKAHLTLGGFTVITGPTGSGKSAVIRALRLAAFNRRGTDFIRHSAKTCKAGFGSQDQDQGWFLAIERGGRGRDVYRLARPGSDGEPVSQDFTKLGGEAPPEILRVHGLGQLNFAGQFDHPYLLDASGSQVARILGDLTNVSLVYEAAREAARRKQRIAAELRRAESEVASLAEQVQQYAGLPAQRAAQERAEAILRKAQDQQAEAARLAQLIKEAEAARLAVATAATAVAVAEPPSLEHAESLNVRRSRLQELYLEVEAARRSAGILQENAAYFARAENAARDGYRKALIEAGRCPMCGQPVHGEIDLATLLVSSQVDDGKAGP